MSLAEACRRWIDGRQSIDERRNFYNICMILQTDMGRCAAAQRDGEQALTYCQGACDEASRLAILGNLALNLGRMGRMRAAQSLRREALALATRFDGAVLPEAFNRLNLAAVLIHLGEYAEALTLADGAETALAPRSPPSIAWAHVFRGWALLRMGQFARARRSVQEALARADAPPETRADAWRLAHELQQDSQIVWEGTPPLQAFAELLKDVSIQRLHLGLQLMRARQQAPSKALSTLEDLRERARSGEMMGLVLEAHVLGARIAAAIDPAQAMRHVEAALALSGTVDYVFSYRGEFWLYLARGMPAAGHTERALNLVAEGAEWVRRTARLQVPEPFRESFLHRNPVNVELLALAAELGRGMA